MVLINFQIGLDHRPVGIALRHLLARMGREFVGMYFVVYQIQLAVDNPKRFRIDVDGDRAGAGDFGSGYLWKYAQQPYPERVEQAWAVALVLMLFVLIVNVTARVWIQNRARRMKG